MSYKVALILGRDPPNAIEARNRAHAGAGLYNAGLVSRLITTGKNGEARTLAEILHSDGVPYEAIIIEPFSRSTIENLRFASDILGSMDGPIKGVYIISQEWHWPRIQDYLSPDTNWNYPYEFCPAEDGRPDEEIQREIELEMKKRSAA